jgi:hypothetical protein
VRSAKVQEETTHANVQTRMHLLGDTTISEWIIRHAEELDLKKGQREVYYMFSRYMQDPTGNYNDVPPITLLHGAAGTGKSTVTHAIIDVAKFLGRRTLRTAFNSINALAIGGDTTASIIRLQVQIHQHQFQEPSFHVHQQIMNTLEGVSLVLVDEVSNQAPFHLAQLSYVCQLGRNEFNKPFGGIPILLVGDLNQLGPVKAGLSLPQAVMAICQHKRKPAELSPKRCKKR